MRRVRTGSGRFPPVNTATLSPVLPSPHNRPYFYCSESDMPQLIRDKSPRLTTDMRRSRGGDKSSSPSPSPNRKKEVKKDGKDGKTSRSSTEKACPPALSSGRCGMSDGSMQRTFHEAMRQRRTSLPANSLHIGKVAQPCGSNVAEARGMVVDMLVSKDLPSNVVSCLKAVASLLNPHSNLMLNSFNDFGLPSVVEDPFSGEQLIVNNSSKPRVSNITFSTVTSATGLPTIAAEPNQPRSSSYWRPDSSPASSDRNPRDHSRSNSLNRTGVEDGLTSTREASRDSSVNKVYEKTSVGSISDRRETRLGRANSTASSNVPGPSSAGTYPTRRTNSCTATDDVSTFQGAQASSVVTTMDQTKFDTIEIDKDRNLQMIADWSLPIFDMAAHHPQTILSRLTYTIFKQADLFRIFKISPIKFFNYFHSLEEGYWDIPYHNRIHAADVLHGCYYLTCHGVRPSFGPSASPDSLLPQPLPPAQSLSTSMSTLELMALYTAAAMHDYDHPGRTNAFLVACEDKKAILYNDRSVLENHHAAESWRLLCSKGCNFIESLDAAETKRFRYLVLEYILATDLKHHFEIIMTFNEKTTDMELSNESDRLLISKLVIKMADINSPCKPYPLHRQWTERICDEFYNQGDEEKHLNMTVTPYMDRDDAQVAKLQDSFIAHIVSPLAVAMNEAGLLPVLPGLVEPEMMINLKHNHQKWLQEIDSSSSSSVAGLGNGIIEEESSSSDSPDVRKRSPSIGSDVEDAFDMCTIQEHDEEEYL